MQSFISQVDSQTNNKDLTKKEGLRWLADVLANIELSLQQRDKKVLQDTTSVQSTATSSAQTLWTNIIPKNNLIKIGDILEFTFFGSFATNARSKELVISLGGTTILDGTTVPENFGVYEIKIQILVTAAGQTITCKYSWFATSLFVLIYTIAAGTFDFTLDQTITLQGIVSATAVAGDILLDLVDVTYKEAP